MERGIQTLLPVPFRRQSHFLFTKPSSHSSRPSLSDHRRNKPVESAAFHRKDTSIRFVFWFTVLCEIENINENCHFLNKDTNNTKWTAFKNYSIDRKESYLSTLIRLANMGDTSIQNKHTNNNVYTNYGFPFCKIECIR